MIDTLYNVLAPIEKVPRYRLWTGCRNIRLQIPGYRMYLAALSAVNSTNNTRLTKKKKRDESFMTCELVPYGNVWKRIDIDPVPKKS